MPAINYTEHSSGPSTRMARSYVTPEMAKDLSYYGMSKDELQEELKARDLPTSGNKDELIQRLQESD